MTRKFALIVALVLALGALSAGIATAAGIGIGGDDAEQPITGAAFSQARAAALAETGGGRVTDTEVGDEESYYEVEVTRTDGSQVDVQLDRSFNVVGASADEENGDDQDGPDGR